MKVRDGILEIETQSAFSKTVETTKYKEILNLSEYVNSKSFGKFTSGAILYHIGYTRATQRDNIEALGSNDISELSKALNIDVDTFISAVNKITTKRKSRSIRFKRILRWCIAHDKSVQSLSIFDKKSRIAFINRPYPSKKIYKLSKGDQP